MFDSKDINNNPIPDTLIRLANMYNHVYIWRVFYLMQVPVKCVDGKLYVRISAHIYNEMKDYERLAEAVLEQKKEMPKLMAN